MTAPQEAPESRVLELTVRITVRPQEGQALADAKNEMTRLVTDYLTSGEHAFMADYGPEAAGGYEGPFALGVAVS